MNVDRIVEELCGMPVSPAEAKRPEIAGGLPAQPGLYAWWTTTAEALPTAPLTSVHGRDEWLLYVGIAPGRVSSKQTMRSRVLGNHLGGNLGSSTFRLTLASLLWESEGWTPEWPRDRVQLSPVDNAALSAWQQRHLRISWAEQPEPYHGGVEEAVIATLAPPLNLAANQSHPFQTVLSSARTALRDAARSR